MLISNSIINDVPFSPEKTKSSKQSSVITPPNSISVPSPAGITAPENENAKTVELLEEIVNPFDVASPPEALSTHPL